jgi:uncharacterized protein YycO
MKNKILSLVIVIMFLSLQSCMSQEFKNGDIIFHTSKSSQSKMVQLVTNSKLSHCGIIFYTKGKPYVFEAVQPVKITPLQQWINRGVGGKYIVSRVKTPLTNSQLTEMYDYAKSQLGKDYDLKFQWSDKKMYCSELVYKVFVAGDRFIGEGKKFSDYNLNNKVVKAAIKNRYGNSINLNEMVITPVDIFKSSEVKTVFNNY